MHKGEILLVNGEKSSLMDIMAILIKVDQLIDRGTRIFYLPNKEPGKNGCSNFEIDKDIPKEISTERITVVLSHVAYHRWDVLIHDENYVSEVANRHIDLSFHDLSMPSTREHLVEYLFKLGQDDLFN